MLCFIYTGGQLRLPSDKRTAAAVRRSGIGRTLILWIWMVIEAYGRLLLMSSPKAWRWPSLFFRPERVRNF